MPRGAALHCGLRNLPPHWDGRYAARGGDLGATSCGNRELGSEVVRVGFDTEFGRSTSGGSEVGFGVGSRSGDDIY